MDYIYSITAGLDVHKKMVVCTILKVQILNNEKILTKEVKEFQTFRKDLQCMAKWLFDEKVEVAVMESTSVYWMPIFEVCEEFQVNAMVVNAFHVKNVPGRKTDENDSEWLAKLSMSGLLNKSFIPGKDLREIRAVTRYRKKVVQNLASEKNRLAKYLDASGIRIGNVVSKIDGVYSVIDNRSSFR